MEAKRIGNNVIILSIKNKFDINKVQTFDHTLRELFDRHTRTIAINMADIKRIDSLAISSLMKAHSLAQNLNIDFILLNLPKHIRLVFEASSLLNFFHILTEKEFKKKFELYEKDTKDS
jgi:anti-anti-sigma factor